MSTRQQASLREKQRYLKKPGVVVDKSYLHKFSFRDSEVLNGEYLLLMSETLLYEVTKDEEDRSRLLKNVREYSANFAYVEHYHTYIEFEKRHIRKSPPPSHFFRHRDYSGFELMVDNKFEDVEELILGRKRLIERNVESVIGLARTLRKTYADAFSGRNEVAALKRQKLEEQVASNSEFVRTYLAKNSIVSFGEARDIATKIALKATEQWAHYRVAQAVLLLAIDVAYRQNLKEPIAEVTLENIRHDVLDSQILILATLVGRIATRDNKINKWWELLMRKPVDFGRAD